MTDIIILYQNYHMEKINYKHPNLGKMLNDKLVRCILIPVSEDTERAFIPIRRNDIYDFHTATVELEYQTHIYFCEENFSQTNIVYDKMVCDNIITFINYLHNLIKFKHISKLYESNSSEMYIFPFTYPVSICITYRDINGNELYKMDTGDMGVIEPYTDMHIIDEEMDNRLNVIRDIFYDNEKINFATIYKMNMNATYSKVSKVSDLPDDCIILIYNRDFGYMYMLSHAFFKLLVGVTKFEISYVSFNIEEYDYRYSNLQTTRYFSKNIDITETKEYLRHNLFSNDDMNSEIYLNPISFVSRSFDMEIHNLVFMEYILIYHHYLFITIMNELASDTDDVFTFAVLVNTEGNTGISDNNTNLPPHRLTNSSVLDVFLFNEKITREKKYNAFINAFTLSQY